MTANKIIIFILLIALAGFSLWFIYSPQEQREEAGIEEAGGTVLYIINGGEDGIKTYELEIFQTPTVFSLLEELAEKENLIIESSSYPEMGVFVESIDGLKGGADNKWWQYWINGQLGEIAADKKEVRTGDVIEWRFEVPLEF